MAKQTFGIIVSTRGFFPSSVVEGARKGITEVLDKLGHDYIMVGEKDTKYGAVLTYEEAKTCAKLFREHQDEITGIIVVLPNFGEELGIAEAISLSRLNVPVLIQACDDDFDQLDLDHRRDAFCGKISLCNNLYQRNIPFSLTTNHTCKLDSPEFEKDVERFAAVCNVVHGIRTARIAMLGARPVAFNTVRYSEKILQKYGIAVQTVDFSEVIFNAMNYSDEEKVAAKVKEIYEYGDVAPHIPEDIVVKQAKLCLAIEEQVEKYEATASTVQCWDSVEENYGVATCLAMSMMGDKGKPSACESDVTGAVSMLAAYLATDAAPALMDWNNNVRENRNACVCLHCSNFPKSFFQKESIEIESLDVVAKTIGKAKCFGCCKGQVAAGDMTFFRVTTDDQKGTMRAYLGEGSFVDEEVKTLGGVANCRVDDLQGLLKYVCKNGFEHHVCFVRGHVADILEEAFTTYLGVEVYRHN